MMQRCSLGTKPRMLEEQLCTEKSHRPTTELPSLQAEKPTRLLSTLFRLLHEDMGHNLTLASPLCISELYKLLENWAELQSQKQTVNVQNVCVVGGGETNRMLGLQKGNSIKVNGL